MRHKKISSIGCGRLLKNIDRNGYDGNRIGKPERLNGDLAAYWS
ncbi:MAG: type II toxin-antitoxin system YoeB family toxin [Hungatella sp.]|nr:type II toxin-antitoxin system YoeB family toxin [Hungatella sp.]